MLLRRGDRVNVVDMTNSGKRAAKIVISIGLIHFPGSWKCHLLADAYRWAWIPTLKLAPEQHVGIVELEGEGSLERFQAELEG